MPSGFNHFVDTLRSNGRFAPVARPSAGTLLIRDVPAYPYSWLFAGIAAATALVASVSWLVTAPGTAAGALLPGMLLVGAVLMTRTAITEIHRPGRTIRKTWRVLGFSWSRQYALPDAATAEIRTRNLPGEGYSLSSCTVSLTAKNYRIDLYATGDREDALAVQRELVHFLQEIGGQFINLTRRIRN